MILRGEEHRQMNKLNDDICLKFENIKLTEKTSKMTDFDEKINKYGHEGQGENLTLQRKLAGNKK